MEDDPRIDPELGYDPTAWITISAWRSWTRMGEAHAWEVQQMEYEFKQLELTMERDPLVASLFEASMMRMAEKMVDRALEGYGTRMICKNGMINPELER